MKKFKNLWTTGIIICLALLVVFYLIKTIFPQFVVGVAQTDAIVKFGHYVENNKWAFYLFSFATSMFGYYFICCAGCRTRKLTIWQFLILTFTTILLFVVQIKIPTLYLSLNMLSIVGLPTLFCFMNKNEGIKYLYSITTTFCIHTFAQWFSLQIRDISMLISRQNIATYTILLIDAYIWLVLLYNYYNYKEVK